MVAWRILVDEHVPIRPPSTSKSGLDRATTQPAGAGSANQLKTNRTAGKVPSYGSRGGAKSTVGGPFLALAGVLVLLGGGVLASRSVRGRFLRDQPEVAAAPVMDDDTPPEPVDPDPVDEQTSAEDAEETVGAQEVVCASAIRAGGPLHLAAHRSPVGADRRGAQRVPLAITATLRWRHLEAEVMTIDVSMSGLSCRLQPSAENSPPSLKDEVLVLLPLLGQVEQIAAQVMRRIHGEDGIVLGLQLHSITPGVSTSLYETVLAGLVSRE